MMRKNLETTLQIVKNYLVLQPDVLVAYLYGSQSVGEERDGSDLDIAVLLNEEKSKDITKKLSFCPRDYDLQVEIQKLVGEEPEIHVHQLNKTPIFFQYRALKPHHVLYSADEKIRTNYEVKTLNKYFDFKPILNEMLAQGAELAGKENYA